MFCFRDAQILVSLPRTNYFKDFCNFVTSYSNIFIRTSQVGILALQQRHFWVSLGITFTVSMCAKYLLRLPYQGKMPYVIYVSIQSSQSYLTCHNILPVSASRRFIQLTRNPERISSAFAGIVMSRSVRSKLEWKKFILNSATLSNTYT